MLLQFILRGTQTQQISNVSRFDAQGMVNVYYTEFNDSPSNCCLDITVSTIVVDKLVLGILNPRVT